MICGGVQEDAEGAVLQFECRVFIAGVLEGVAGKSPVERIECADKDEDIVWQIAILGSSGSGAHVRHALVVAAAFGKLLLVASLHFHRDDAVVIPQEHVHDDSHGVEVGFVLVLCRKVVDFPNPHPKNQLHHLTADVLVVHHPRKDKVVGKGEALPLFLQFCFCQHCSSVDWVSYILLCESDKKMRFCREKF